MSAGPAEPEPADPPPADPPPGRIPSGPRGTTPPLAPDWIRDALDPGHWHPAA